MVAGDTKRLRLFELELGKQACIVTLMGKRATPKNPSLGRVMCETATPP